MDEKLTFCHKKIQNLDGKWTFLSNKIKTLTKNWLFVTKQYKTLTKNGLFCPKKKTKSQFWRKKWRQCWAEGLLDNANEWKEEKVDCTMCKQRARSSMSPMSVGVEWFLGVECLTIDPLTKQQKTNFDQFWPQFNYLPTTYSIHFN